MRFQRAWMTALQTLALLLAAVPVAFGQNAPGVVPANYNPGGGQMYVMPDGGVMPAGVINANYLMQLVQQAIMQAGYAGLTGHSFDYPPQYGAGATADPGMEYCETCGQYGHHDGPYMTGTCGPRWFDASVEALYLKREDASRTMNFASDGARGLGEPNIVLSSDDLTFQEEVGARATARYDIGPASVIEGRWMYYNGSPEAAIATSDTDNLFSVFSDFGGAALFPGFDETDSAFYQSIILDFDVQTIELNWRRDWISSAWRAYGSFMAGVRYGQLGERFRYITLTDDGELDYRTRTENDLIGFQTGGDVFFCVFPGLTAGGDIRAGVYNNNADQITTFTATSLDPTVEREESNDVALIAEAEAMVIYQITPALSIKGGYMVYFMDGVALATENFNSIPPFVGTPPRDTFINDNGSFLMHGATAGIEWIW